MTSGTSDTRPAPSEAQPGRRAVFLDRDGTVLEEAGYLDRLERLFFFPFAIDAIRLLNRAGFAVVIITNQSGVGRGMYEEEFVQRAHEVVDERQQPIAGHFRSRHHPCRRIHAAAAIRSSAMKVGSTLGRGDASLDRP